MADEVSIDRRLLATQSIDFGAAVADRDESSKPYDDEGVFARDVDGRLIRIDRSTAADFDTDVRLSIDGREVTVKKAVPRRDSQGVIQRDDEGNAIPRPTTIYDAASVAFVTRAGDPHPIPTLCHREHMPPIGVCRVCVVEAAEQTRRGMRSKLVPACVQRVTDGMVVQTLNSQADSEAAERVRRACGVLTELLIADHLPPDRPAAGETAEDHDGNASNGANNAISNDGNELAALARRLHADPQRFELIDRQRRSPQRVAERKQQSQRRSSLMVAIDADQCIMCGRCLRGCNVVKQNHVIGRFGKGYTNHIGFDLDDPMGKSSCVSCGECVISCPTGALEFQPSYLADRDDGRGATDIDRLLSIPLFSGLPPKFVQFNHSSFVFKQLDAGDVLCQEGEYGSTAFVIVSGRFEAFLQASQPQPARRRWRFWRREPAAPGGGQGISSSVAKLSDLQGAELQQNQRIEITPADLILGEMTCLNGYPRSATVVATEPSEVVEIGRNVLYMIQRSAACRAALEQVYRSRALRGQLAALPVLEGLSDQRRQEAADLLSPRVDLVTAEPDQVIFREGEPADAIYINRLGFIKVLQRYGMSDRVLSYLSPGSYFGEIGLLTKLLDDADWPGQRVARVTAGRRTTTCLALDHVELIRIRAADFRELLRRFPEIVPSLTKKAQEFLERDFALRKQLDAIGTDDFIEQGLFLGQSLLVLDLEKCTRCDECTKACSDAHGGVTRLVREGKRFDRFLIASSCRSCMDPYCLVGCPVDAIHRSGNSLEIRIEDHCIGCGLCATNCPYGNINMHGFPKTEVDPRSGKSRQVYEMRGQRKVPVIQQQATTCDLCSSVGGRPRCVYACPHDAAHRVNSQQLLQIIERDGQAQLG